MSSDALARRRRRRARRSRKATEHSSSEEIETIDLDIISSAAAGTGNTTIQIPSVVQGSESIDQSPLIEIIRTKGRKDWAKLVAPVDEHQIRKKKQSLTTRLANTFSKIPSPGRFILDSIEHRYGYAIRSYFEFILWLFYLNIFTFIVCFTCIIMPTYIYPNSIDFSVDAMNQYYRSHNRTFYNQSSDLCSLVDPQCQVLDLPLKKENMTCLNNSFTAASCCSLHNDVFLQNSSRAGENDWQKFLIDLTDGTGYLTLTRLFIGYYRNLTQSTEGDSYFQTYNMGLAVFLTIFACFLFNGIVIVRKYGDGMKRSYVQNESFKTDLFQYIFARWDYRTISKTIGQRHQHRFKTEIRNILLEQHEKVNFKFDRAKDKILFQLQRIALWIGTLIIFAAAIAAVYFTNRFTFQERAKTEMNAGRTDTSDFRTLLIAYLPSLVISVINFLSQILFWYMKDFKLYTHTTAIRHYFIRVIIMRLLLLLAFVFIMILQITCNSNQCGRQSELIDCAGIEGTATFIHCWETLIGQVIYRLVLTDTVIVLIVHLIIDPLRSLLICCCGSRRKVEDEERTTIIDQQSSNACFLFQPLEFEVEDYVLDLTYTQTLCWHGLLFCPFLPLIGAIKNLLIFVVKWFSLATFRRRSNLELSPARARYIFTAVLLFSFVWALLPIAFLTTSLRPSRGCSPFRIYSHEPDFYIYYSIRNLVSQINNEILVTIIFKFSNAVVIVPIILILILLSCILTIQRNSYRNASIELYKLLYTSHKTHQLAVQNTTVISTTL